MKNHRFTFMGTGAGCGVPAFFCECPACEEARRNSEVARGDCGVMVRGLDEQGAPRVGATLLIDTPPDTRHQLNREGVRTIDQLLYTHWHSDHIGGLLEMEYMVELVTKSKLATFGSAYTLAQIETEFAWMCDDLDLRQLVDFDTVEYDGVRYTALPVTHAPGTFGFLIETDETRLFYASDTGLLPPETKERIRGVDVLAMDATYWGDCPCPAAHHSVQQCIEEGLELDAKTIYLTHLCMHYTEPITHAQLDEYLVQYGGRVRQAMDGLSFLI